MYSSAATILSSGLFILHETLPASDLSMICEAAAAYDHFVPVGRLFNGRNPGYHQERNNSHDLNDWPHMRGFWSVFLEEFEAFSPPRVSTPLGTEAHLRIDVASSGGTEHLIIALWEAALKKTYGHS